MEGSYGSRRLRHGRISESGRTYHVRFSTRLGSPSLSELSVARSVIAGLIETAPQAETLCYVVMPDHVHWLLRLKDGGDLSGVVRKVKSLASRGIRRVSGQEVFGWQPGFFDRALRRDEDLAAVARYIVANPVRSGLVSTVRDYPHWDAVWLEG